MFTVKIPAYLEEVSKYTFRLLFEYFWGQSIRFESHELDVYIITDDQTKAEVKLPAVFIKSEKECWLEPHEAKNWQYHTIDYSGRKDFPVWFERKKESEETDTKIDFPGTIFFLLNRYHELVEEIPNEDHGRIEASKTMLVRQGLIYEPVADLYIECFYDFLKVRLNLPDKRKTDYEILPSHDVDRPFEYLYYTFPHLLKRITGDILARRSVDLATERFSLYKKVKNRNLSADPYNTFDWIMNEVEKSGWVSTFHFITQNTIPAYDQDYKLDHPEIESLLLSIHQRGHQIALHPSYGSTEMSSQIKNEFELMRKKCEELNITQDKWKSRTHYMRWNKHTLSELESAGVDVDQTIGFAQQPGFRCGTCRAFRPFNYQNMKESTVIFESLLMMELSLFSPFYLDLANDIEKAWSIVNGLKKECKNYGGKFTFLWHNNQLISGEMKDFFKGCLK